MDQRHATRRASNTHEIAVFPRRLLRAPLQDLDRRTAKSWIVLVALAVLVACAGACSGVPEETGENQSAIAQAGRWRLPAAALSAGEKVRLSYDAAPKWTGTAACGRGLRAGGAKLGSYLMGKFTIVSSVGGFACRRNTADSSRMSVHGTGRALDVFVPRSSGSADNGQGDKIANWLVMNAQRIGVQLIIWDRTVWRANGTNDSTYTGPHPHDDHLHVELTNEAGDAKTAWFLDMTDDDAGTTPTADAGTTTTDDDDDDDAGTTTTPAKDAGMDAAKDAGSPDASPTEPPDDDGPVQDPPSSPEPKSDTLPDEPSSGDPSGDYESADDEPGETNSLPGSSKRKSTSSLDDEPLPNAGCSAAPGGGTSNPFSAGGAVLAVALGFAAMRRRKTTRRD